VIDTLARHAPSRDLMQLAMYERYQTLERRLVALPPLQQQPGDLCRFFADAVILGRFDPVSGLAPGFPLLQTGGILR
jgi:hypothetical protein